MGGVGMIYSIEEIKEHLSRGVHMSRKVKTRYGGVDLFIYSLSDDGVLMCQVNHLGGVHPSHSPIDKIARDDLTVEPFEYDYKHYENKLIRTNLPLVNRSFSAMGLTGIEQDDGSVDWYRDGEEWIDGGYQCIGTTRNGEGYEVLNQGLTGARGFGLLSPVSNTKHNGGQTMKAYNYVFICKSCGHRESDYVLAYTCEHATDIINSLFDFDGWFQTDTGELCARCAARLHPDEA
jgi:hypothetical protein